MANSNRGVWYV